MIDPAFSDVSEADIGKDPLPSLNKLNLPNLIRHNFKTNKMLRGSKSVRLDRYTNRIRRNPALSLYYNGASESFDIEKLKTYHYLNRLKKKANNIGKNGDSEFSIEINSHSLEYFGV